MSEAKIVAECWTCGPRCDVCIATGSRNHMTCFPNNPAEWPYGKRLYTEIAAADHRAARHDVRPVEPQKG